MSRPTTQHASGTARPPLLEIRHLDSLFGWYARDRQERISRSFVMEIPGVTRCGVERRTYAKQSVFNAFFPTRGDTLRIPSWRKYRAIGASCPSISWLPFGGWTPWDWQIDICSLPSERFGTGIGHQSDPAAVEIGRVCEPSTQGFMENMVYPWSGDHRRIRADRTLESLARDRVLQEAPSSLGGDITQKDDGMYHFVGDENGYANRAMGFIAIACEVFPECSQPYPTIGSLEILTNSTQG